jgi:hypothetical protein
MDMIVWLETLRATDEGAVGAKAAGLGELLAAGFTYLQRSTAPPTPAAAPEASRSRSRCGAGSPPPGPLSADGAN